METKNIFQRMNAVMQAVSYVQKEAKKSGMQYSFVSHDSVTALLRPHFVEQGVVYYPHSLTVVVDGNRVQMQGVVRFVNIDNPVDVMDVHSYGFGIDSQDKGPGKAMSYLVKYALLKATGLETGDDPERDSINHVPEGTIKQMVAEAAEERFGKKARSW